MRTNNSTSLIDVNTCYTFCKVNALELGLDGNDKDRPTGADKHLQNSDENLYAMLNTHQVYHIQFERCGLNET